MRLLLGCTLVMAACSGLSADDKKGEKIDAKLLVGKWSPKGDKAPVPMTLEFTKDGKVSLVAGPEGKEERSEGTYTLEGNKLSLKMKLGDREEAQTVTVSKLTDTDLVGANEQGKERAFVRVKEKGKK